MRTTSALPRDSIQLTEQRPLLAADGAETGGICTHDCFAPADHRVPDMARFELKRGVLTPWTQHPVRPHGSHAGKVPLDVDEIASGIGNSLRDSSLGPAVTAALLSVGGIFAAQSATGAWHLWHVLGHRERALRGALAAVRVSPEATCEWPTQPQHGCVENLRGWEQVMERELLSTQVRRWLQIPCGVGATCVSLSIFCNPALGGFSHPVRHLGRALAWVGTPAMTMFAAGSALEAIAYARSVALGDTLQGPRALAKDDVVCQAADLAHNRNHALMQAHLCMATGGALMAVGIASTFAYGPTGLVAMVPGLLALQVGLVWRNTATDLGDVHVHSDGLARQGGLRYVAHRAVGAHARHAAMEAVPAARWPWARQPASLRAGAAVRTRAAVEMAIGARESLMLQRAHTQLRWCQMPVDTVPEDLEQVNAERLVWRRRRDAIDGALPPEAFRDAVTMVVADKLFEDFAWHLQREAAVRPWFAIEADGKHIVLAAEDLLAHAPTPPQWEAICRALTNTWCEAGARRTRQRAQALLELYTERLRGLKRSATGSLLVAAQQV